MRRFLRSIVVLVTVVALGLPAHAQSRASEPVGAVFCSLVATLGGLMAAVLLSPMVTHRDGIDDASTAGYLVMTLSAASLAAGVSLSVPRESHVRVALNGLTIRW